MRIISGVRVVGGANLAQRQLDLANLFISRTEFSTRYPASLATADQFVDAVLATLLTDMGVNLASQRANLISPYNTQGGRGAWCIAWLMTMSPLTR